MDIMGLGIGIHRDLLSMVRSRCINSYSEKSTSDSDQLDNSVTLLKTS